MSAWASIETTHRVRLLMVVREIADGPHPTPVVISNEGWAAIADALETLAALGPALPEVCGEMDRIRNDGFCDDAASAVGAMIGAADSCHARCGSPEERAAVLETIARGLLAIRALDQYRRTVISNLLDETGDLALVQKIIGHTDPKTTVRY